MLLLNIKSLLSCYGLAIFWGRAIIWEDSLPDSRPPQCASFGRGRKVRALFEKLEMRD